MDLPTGQPTPSVRLDKWLWAVRIFRTRSQATDACRGGHVRVSGQPAKPAHAVKLQEIITARVGELTRTFKVLGLIERRVGGAVAKEFVEDLTPAAEYDKPRAPKVRPLFIRPKGLGRPTKKDRRSLDKLW